MGCKVWDLMPALSDVLDERSACIRHKYLPLVFLGVQHGGFRVKMLCLKSGFIRIYRVRSVMPGEGKGGFTGR